MNCGKHYNKHNPMKNIHHLFGILFIASVAVLGAQESLQRSNALEAAASAASDVMDLRVELEKSPVGLDTARPRFSWKLKPQVGKRGQMQKAVSDENP